MESCVSLQKRAQNHCADSLSTSTKPITFLSSTPPNRHPSDEQHNLPNDPMSQNVQFSLTDDLWSLSELSPTESETNISETIPCSIEKTDHWSKASCDNLKGRISLLFLNEFMSDIRFVFNSTDDPNTAGNILPAHKFILATASTVFYALFYGPLSDDRKQIIITDIESDTFTELLRYLYCDQIEADDVDRLLGLIYASKKYLLHHLCDQCVNKLQQILCAENACLILEQALLFDQTPLANQALEFIDAQTQLCLMSDNTSYISLHTLQLILGRSTLNASETAIYDGLERWCDSQAAKKEHDPVKDNANVSDSTNAHSIRRQLSGDAVNLIRFPTMKLSEFANGAAQSDLLTSDEIADIFLYFTAEKAPKPIFSTEKRVGLKTRRCSRFKSSAFRTNQWRYRGRCDSIQFTVSRRIFLTGIGLFGSSNGPYHYGVELQIKQSNSIVHKESTGFQSDGTSSIFTVPIDGSPIQIDTNKVYTVCVTIEGSELSYFGQDGMSHVKIEPDINFHFYSSPESTNGTGVQGGQIAELQFFCPSVKDKTSKG